MPKRKGPDSKVAQADSGSDDNDIDMLDVEFEYFDVEEIDFHGIKLLLKQLFDADKDLFDISALSDLIISQPFLGSTVKVADDEHAAKENDPFAFFSVLNLHAHTAKPGIKSLKTYLTTKALSIASLSSTALPTVLYSTTPDTQVGLILAERFINMPAEIAPPMYRGLLNELAHAREANDPYAFTHYLILSKTYTEVDSTLPGVDDDDEGGAAPPSKKSKKQAKKRKSGGETFFFHPEDEVLMRHAVAKGEFAYTKEEADGASDAKRAFQDAGIRPMGCMILVEAARFEQAVKDVEAYVGGGVMT